MVSLQRSRSGQEGDGRRQRQGTHKDLARRSRPTSDNHTSHRGSENEIALGPRDDAGAVLHQNPCLFRPFLAHTQEHEQGTSSPPLAPARIRPDAMDPPNGGTGQSCGVPSPDAAFGGS